MVTDFLNSSDVMDKNIPNVVVCTLCSGQGIKYSGQCGPNQMVSAVQHEFVVHRDDFRGRRFPHLLHHEATKHVVSACHCFFDAHGQSYLPILQD